MTVIYVDSVFVLNTLMDYLLLIATARLSGISLNRFRCFYAAILGGIYAVAVFLPRCDYLSTWPVKVSFGFLLSAVAYGRQRHYLRLTVLMFAISCGMAGCVLAMGLLSGGVPMQNGVFYTDVDARILLIAAGVAYLLLTVVFRAGAKHHVCGTLVPAEVSVENRHASLIALCDTGNALLDPATGRPVLVVFAPRLKELWNAEIRTVMSEDAMRDPVRMLERLNGINQETRFSLVPYNAVGVRGGLLLAFRCDYAVIGGKRYERLLIALSPTELGASFSALWGESGGGKKHVESVEATVPADKKSTAATASSLHRWK